MSITFNTTDNAATFTATPCDMQGCRDGDRCGYCRDGDIPVAVYTDGDPVNLSNLSAAEVLRAFGFPASVRGRAMSAELRDGVARALPHLLTALERSAAEAENPPPRWKVEPGTGVAVLHAPPTALRFANNLARVLDIARTALSGGKGLEWS